MVEINTINVGEISDLLERCSFLALNFGKESIDERFGKSYTFVFPDNILEIIYSSDWGGRRAIYVKQVGRAVFIADDIKTRDVPFESAVNLDYFDVGFCEQGNWQRSINDFYDGCQYALERA